MQNHHYLLKYIVHICMSLIWIGIFAFFVYIPSVIVRLMPQQKSLNIFTWPGTLDPIYLARFEQETGIKLHINYYESNQELVTKLQATGGVGYDVVVPSDYIVNDLIKTKLIKKLDKSKLLFWNNIRPELLNLYFDPNSDYSIPFFWSIYGLGIDTRFFQNKAIVPSWSLIFHPQKEFAPIGMTNYPREAVMIAAQYLFGSIDILTNSDNIAAVIQLLQQQKKFVYAYTDDRAKELLISHACPVVVAQRADIVRTQKEHPYIQFLIPQEGSFAYIESIVIPTVTNKDELIYSFINFLYQSEVMAHHVSQFAFCPPIALPVEDSSFCTNELLMHNLDFFRPIIPSETINDIWLALMTGKKHI